MPKRREPGMTGKNTLNRREALKVAALTALSLPLIGVPSVSAAETNSFVKTSVKKAGRAPALKLGVASYSLAKLPVEGVIAVLKELEITGVSLYKSHAPWADGTPEQCRAVVQKFSDAGITVTSTGMIELPNDEAVVRKALDNVRAAGLTTFCGWLKQTDSLPLLNRMTGASAFASTWPMVSAPAKTRPRPSVYAANACMRCI